MSSPTPSIHPQGQPSPPYWRGCSDLTGEYGDFLYGTYRRSTNAYVKNGAALAKRRGYERSLDEVFWWNAAVHTYRNGSERLVLVADGEGVKVLAGLPSSTYSGFTINHPGFPNDDFVRNDNASIAANTQNPWVEGQDSEYLNGPTGADAFEIVSNELSHASADGATAEADWRIATPTPFWALRGTLDFSNLTLAAGEEYAFYAFLGMPGVFYRQLGATTIVGRPNQYAADGRKTYEDTQGQQGAVWTCWTGLVFRVSVTRNSQASSPYNVIMRATEFSADRPPGELPDNGMVSPIGYQIGSSPLSSLGSWTFEVGRRALSGGKWRVVSSMWEGETVASITAQGAGIDPDIERASDEVYSGFSYNQGGAGSRYIRLPLDGDGGFFGVSSKFPDTSSGTVTVTELTCDTAFVNPRP